MASNTSKLVPYNPSGFPILPGGEQQYLSSELKKVGRAVRSIEEIMVKLEASGTVGIKAGIVTAADIPDGGYKVIHDTSGDTVKLYVNISGTLKSVALS